MDWFDVKELDGDRLLVDWRWLCPGEMVLIARNAFGDLFLRDSVGEIFRLDVGIGRFSKIADSETQFRKLSESKPQREEWFAEADENSAKSEGLVPGPFQCIGFKIPIVFAESGKPGNAYVADIYEQVSFLGDLNRQISSLPEGAKVELRVQPPKGN
jgi:hypothetical protein